MVLSALSSVRYEGVIAKSRLSLLPVSTRLFRGPATKFGVMNRALPVDYREKHDEPRASYCNYKPYRNYLANYCNIVWLAYDLDWCSETLPHRGYGVHRIPIYF